MNRIWRITRIFSFVISQENSRRLGGGHPLEVAVFRALMKGPDADWRWIGHADFKGRQRKVPYAWQSAPASEGLSVKIQITIVLR